MKVRVIITDALTDTVVEHSEENSPVYKTVEHVCKLVGGDVDEAEWFYKKEIVSPKGTTTVEFGVIEYKSIIVIIKN